MMAIFFPRFSSIAFFLCLVAFVSFFVTVKSQDNRYTTQKQACGDKLADMLQLVCNGRGYNVAFRAPHNSDGLRRIRRGVVQECCKKSCSTDILELYCSPVVPESPPGQIRKRSDNEKGWSSSEEDINSINPTENPIEKNKEDTDKLTTGIFKVLLGTNKVDMSNTITNYNKEVTESTIQEKLNSLYQGKEHHKTRIFHSSREVSNGKDNTFAERNHLGYILNKFSKEEEDTHSTKRPPVHENLLDTIRLRHSKKILLRHQSNRIPVKNSDEENSAAFEIGVRMPYYSGRKQSRPRSHHYSR